MDTVNYLDKILTSAIKQRASDIHVQPERESFNIAFRIDGSLYVIDTLLKSEQEEFISRIKVLSQADITESRLPQQGHFELNFEGKIYNMRISIIPTLYGEAVVLRILNRDDILIKLEELGFDDDQLSAMNRLISSPYGMILITGPCGSGKTVLLYSILNVLKKPGKNILTLEDPVECQITDMRQIQINEKLGLDFVSAMKTALRQDPDVMMLGEIRDAESARMAVQAALTGILFFSTFHTLDVPALVSRLLEIGIPNSIAAQSIVGVVSSRLVRKVCKACGEAHQIDDYEKRVLDGINLEGAKFRKGKGCNACNNSGYYGRVGIFEITSFDDEIRACIIEKQSFSALRKILEQKKVKSLRDAACNKVLSGVTTAEEVVRVIGSPF
ncbi:GspE/PulE family protein [Patescibacteria group bacterium]|nr:GspE/PulE family protein [Patescibacteria group bacterium]